MRTADVLRKKKNAENPATHTPIYGLNALLQINTCLAPWTEYHSGVGAQWPPGTEFVES